MFQAAEQLLMYEASERGKTRKTEKETYGTVFLVFLQAGLGFKAQAQI